MPAEPKTRPTGASVDDFLAAVENPVRRADGFALRDLLAEVTGDPAIMWGPSIVGIGSYRGATGDWPVAGFSPRKAELVVYVLPGFEDKAELMARLGPHRTGVSCLYLKRLDAIDKAALRELVEWSVRTVRDRYPT